MIENEPFMLGSKLAYANQSWFKGAISFKTEAHTRPGPAGGYAAGPGMPPGTDAAHDTNFHPGPRYPSTAGSVAYCWSWLLVPVAGGTVCCMVIVSWQAALSLAVTMLVTPFCPNVVLNCGVVEDTINVMVLDPYPVGAIKSIV